MSSFPLANSCLGFFPSRDGLFSEDEIVPALISSANNKERGKPNARGHKEEKSKIGLFCSNHNDEFIFRLFDCMSVFFSFLLTNLIVSDRKWLRILLY